jgi:hypothetical protein
MSDEENWRIKPLKGLGQLEFGMTPQQVDKFGSIYGAATFRGPDRASDDLVKETLEKFGSGLSEEEKKELLTLYQEKGPPADSISETRGSDQRLMLSYKADRLVEIMAVRDTTKLNYDGISVFEANPRDLIRHMSESLKEIPIAKDDAVVFQKHCIYLYKFLRDKFVDEEDEQDQTFSWRATPEQGGVDLSLYKPLKL